MWVIYDSESGVEIDRIFDDRSARAVVKRLNDRAVYDHFDKRWEA